MDKSIKSYIINIILIVLVLIISFNLWNKLSKNVIVNNVYDKDLGIIMDMTDYSYGANLDNNLVKNIKLVLRNQSNNTKNYDLFVKFISLNEIEFDDLELYLNNKKIELLNPIIDGTTYTFKISSSLLNGYKNRYLEIKIISSNPDLSNISFNFFLK